MKFQIISDSYHQHMYISVVIEANMKAMVFNQFHFHQTVQSYYMLLSLALIYLSHQFKMKKNFHSFVLN